MVDRFREGKRSRRALRAIRDHLGDAVARRSLAKARDDIALALEAAEQLHEQHQRATAIAHAALLQRDQALADLSAARANRETPTNGAYLRDLAEVLRRYP